MHLLVRDRLPGTTLAQTGCRLHRILSVVSGAIQHDLAGCGIISSCPEGIEPDGP